MADNKLYSYVIVLRNGNSRYVNIVGFLLCAVSAVLFLREMIWRQAIIIPYLAGIVFIAGLMAWNAYRYYRLDQEIYYSKALLIAGLVWTRMPYLEWLVVVFALLALLEYQAKLAPEIGFSPEQVVINGPFKKRHPWAAIDNVVLKDGWLTIDFKNNRLIQREIDSGENEASEQEFNQWCRQQLANPMAAATSQPPAV